ncbi:GIY-YIG nuclease family protein [Streptomyces griseosporeus]|uniref:GIY-YIG nuclease family protein n=1 Tax=Streptomyces griseosporeus TaxID=1910 RepID=UPI0037000B9C
MTETPQVHEPEFTDTFDRPAWWHARQWMSARPVESQPQKPVNESTLRRAYAREGIPFPAPVRVDPKPVRTFARLPRSPQWRAASGTPHTYLVTAEGSHLVKIGIAKDPMRRLRELQTGQPMDSFLMWSVEGDYEHALHERFAKYRHRGEWFDLRELGDPVNVVTAAINEMKAAEPSA